MPEKHDPQEDDPRLRDTFDAATKEAEENLRDDPSAGHLGFCHVFWWEKKRILKEKYGIDWKSPDEMNPDVIYD